MVGDVPRIYWDTCVFLSYINGIADRLATVDELVNRARAGHFEPDRP